MRVTISLFLQKRRYSVAALVLLSFLPFLLYWNTLHNDFVFDDMPLIWGSKIVPRLNSVYDIVNLFTEQYGYRPIRTLSYAIDYRFSGTGPVSYHVSNIIYHTITALLVYLVTISLIPQHITALVAALIFAAHPVHTDAVAYLSGRRDILFALFYLAAFWCFLKHRKSNQLLYLIAAIALYFLSIGSKEMGVTLPLVFFIYDVLGRLPQTTSGAPSFSLKEAGRAIRKTLRQHILFYGAFFLCALCFSVYKVFIYPSSHQEGYYGGSVAVTMLTVGRILVHYIKLLLFPIKLIADYSYDAFPLSYSLLEWRTFSSLVMLLCLVLVLIKMLPRNKLITFAGVWFFITVLPVCHIIPHHELLAEHYLYLPSYGFCLAAALLVTPLFNDRKYTAVTISCLLLIIIFFSLRTIDRNRDWKDGMTLWRATVKTVPRCARAQNNLGFYYLNEKKHSEALAHLTAATEIKPEYAEAYNNMGLVFSAQGDQERAINLFIKAFKLNNQYYDALYNLANALERNGRYNSSIWFYEMITRKKPRSPEIHNNLGVVFQKKGELEPAQEQFRMALTIDPDNVEARNNLGVWYNSQGRYAEAVEEFKQALRVNPDNAEVRCNLGTIYNSMKQYDSAIDQFQKALQIKPDSAEAMNNLGTAYKDKGEYDKAIQIFSRTIELFPNLAIPHLNIAIIYLFQKNDRAKALYHFERALEVEPNLPQAAAVRKKIEELKGQ
jgi:tetratricopeptide (TPR) repeat protein